MVRIVVGISLALALSGCANHKFHVAAVQFHGAPPASNSFWAGAAKEELTPPPGFPNAGHGPPAAIARGYWSRLYARAFYFRDNSGNVTVLVSCDLFAVSRGLWHAVLEKVNLDGVPLTAASLVITATHTHQGPGGFMTASGYNVLASAAPGFDREIFRIYVDRIACAVEAAARKAVPAKLILHKGTAGIQRNRAIVPFLANSQAEINSIMGASNVVCPNGDPRCSRLKAVDNSLFTLEAESETGPAIGILVFYVVHPTALRHDAPLMSSDLTGRAMDQLESPAVHGIVPAPKTWPVAGFFNSAEGDISPNWKNQRREDVIGLGDQLAAAVRNLSGSPNLAGALSIDARRQEFPNDWHHERPNGNPKMAAHPTPGAALFGGAEDGRAGILYQQNWRGGVLSNVPGCATALDQGCKVPVLDYPLQDFLRVYGLPTWANTLPIKLHLTKAAAKAGFPERFPIGLVRFGNWLSLDVLPVEMTTAMGHQLKREFPSET